MSGVRWREWQEVVAERDAEIARLRAHLITLDHQLMAVAKGDLLHEDAHPTLHIIADEVERLRTQIAEAKASCMTFGGVLIPNECSLLDNIKMLKGDIDTLQGQRDELRALLREATAPSECAVCHAALLPTLEIPHCEDCIVTDDAAIDYEEASRDFVARLDAVLGGAK